MLANYVGQFYVAGVNVLLLPLQVKLLGSEAYGLVGFFAMLTGWLQLLDVGLSPALARETSKFRAGGIDRTTYRDLLRAVEFVFLAVGVGVAVLILILSRSIAGRWLHPETLSPTTVAHAVAVMGIVFAFRWQAAISRSVMVGLERQVSANAINIVFATLRSVGVLAALHWLGATPGVFFGYQAVVAALELVLLRWLGRRFLGFTKVEKANSSLGFAPLRAIARFSLSVAIAGAVWASATQLDNLLLSKFLPLSEYAWFTLAVMAASGINLLAAPIGQAIQPRLTYLCATGDEPALRATYSGATQVLSAIALTASSVVALCARPLLWAWTGNLQLAARTAPVLAFYALGNGFLSIVAMTYYLQVARGDLRLHLRGNLVFAVLLLPLIIIATIRRGMLGASLVWFGANLAFFLVWSAIVHRKFLHGAHAKWLLRDAAFPGLLGLLASAVLTLVHWAALSRLETGAVLALGGAFSAGVASTATTAAQRAVLVLYKRSQTS